MPRAFLIKKKKFGLSSSYGSAARRQKSMVVGQLHHETDYLEAKSRHSVGSGSEYSSPPPSRSPSPAPPTSAGSAVRPPPTLADLYARTAGPLLHTLPPHLLHHSASWGASPKSSAAAAAFLAPYLQHPYASYYPPYYHSLVNPARRSPDTACPPLSPYTPPETRHHYQHPSDILIRHPPSGIRHHPTSVWNVPTADTARCDSVGSTSSSETAPLRIASCPPSPTLSVGSESSLVVATVEEAITATPTATKPRVSNSADGATAAPRYQCPDCAKSYSTYSGLSKHQQFHCAATNRRTFSCQNCDKTYQSLGALKMHVRTHTLPCKCELCGKCFSRPWLLQGHVRTHTGEKPFQCQHCHRAFADRSNLRAHLQTHSDVKKYSCKACHKTFSRMSLLLKHDGGACHAHQHVTSGAAASGAHVTDDVAAPTIFH